MVEERRQPVDRRQRPTPMFSRFTFVGGRRGDPRRTSEREGAFVDRYGPGVFFVLLLVLTLNVADAFYTLVYLQRGGQEANPIVQQLLDLGMAPFVAVKCLVIGIAVCLLCVCKNFRYAQLGLKIAVGSYSLLALYHLFLYFHTLHLE